VYRKTKDWEKVVINIIVSMVISMVISMVVGIIVNMIVSRLLEDLRYTHSPYSLRSPSYSLLPPTPYPSIPLLSLFPLLYSTLLSLPQKKCVKHKSFCIPIANTKPINIACCKILLMVIANWLSLAFTTIYMFVFCCRQDNIHQSYCSGLLLVKNLAESQLLIQWLAKKKISKNTWM